MPIIAVIIVIIMMSDIEVCACLLGLQFVLSLPAYLLELTISMKRTIQIDLRRLPEFRVIAIYTLWKEELDQFLCGSGSLPKLRKQALKTHCYIWPERRANDKSLLPSHL